MKTKKTIDLTPKSPARVKGGGRLPNDNITLVRGAKPAKKHDLPPRKDIKGGGKRINDNITLVRC